MWEFLKLFRNTEIFKKRPRKPEISVFDDMPGIKGADDMLRKGSPDLRSDEEHKADKSSEQAKKKTKKKKEGEQS